MRTDTRTHTHTQLIGALLYHHCDLIGFPLCSSSNDDADEEDDGDEDDELLVFLPQSFSCVAFILITGRPPLSDTSGSERSGMFTETDEPQHRLALLFLTVRGSPCCSLQGNVTSLVLHSFYQATGDGNRTPAAL